MLQADTETITLIINQMLQVFIILTCPGTLPQLRFNPTTPTGNMPKIFGMLLIPILPTEEPDMILL